MAKLPDITSFGRRPVPRGAEPVRIPTPQPTGEFELSQKLSNISRELGRLKEYDATLMAEGAQNKLSEKAMELKSGDNGFSQIKSSGVMERPVYKEYMDLFDKSVEDIANTLGNDMQKRKFRQRADVVRLQYGNDLTNHVQREKSVYEEQVYKGGTSVELQNAGAHWDEPASIDLSVERTNFLIDTYAKKQGWAKDVIQSVKKKALSDIHTTVIDQAVANDNFEYAQAWFDKHKDNIDSTQHDEITNLIKDSQIKVTAQEFTDDAVNRQLDEKEALAEARGKYQGDEENAVVASIQARYAEIRGLKTNAENEATDTAWKIYTDAIDQGVANPYNQIPVNVLNKMNPKQRAILQKDAKGAKTANGGVDYYKLKVMARDDPNQFRQINPFDYDLSDPDRKEIIKMQTDPVETDYFGSEMFIIDSAAADAGFDPKDKYKDSSKGEDVRKFYERIRQEIKAYSARTGKKPDDQTLKDIVDRLTIKQIKERTIFGIPYWFSKETPVSNLEIPGIPNDVVDELAKAVQDQGQPVTEENIKRLYEYLYAR